MKTPINILLVAWISLFFFSCKEDTVLTPKAEINVNQSQFSINESMVIHFTGIAQQVVIYTGDDSHNYELRNQSNSGLVVNKGLFTYSYATPGVYKVVCVASTYTELATDLKKDTCSFTVTVTDDVTEISKLSCPQILYDEIFAERHENDQWLMKLPRKVKYNVSTPAISLSQKLKFYIESDSTKVSINGAGYASATKYDLSSPLNISVKSNVGTTRLYKLYTLYYPEFATFSLAGVVGILVRNEFDYSTYILQITLPVGTDISSLVPVFTTTSTTDKAYIGDTEQVSGSTPVDFSQGVTYRIVATSADNANMTAESTVSVVISYQ